MALDLLPDNHPEIDAASLLLQIVALRAIGIPSRHTANAILRQAGLPKAF